MNTDPRDSGEGSLLRPAARNDESGAGRQRPDLNIELRDRCQALRRSPCGDVDSRGVRRAIVQPLKILFLSAEVAPFAKAGGLADVCGSLPKALGRPGTRGPRRHAGLQPVEAALPGRAAGHPCAPRHAPGADGDRGGAGGRAGGDAARQRGAGLLHRRVAPLRRPAVLLRLRRRRLSLRLLQPGGARPDHRRPRLASRRGPRPRLAHGPGRHLAGHRRPVRRALRRPADGLHHPQPACTRARRPGTSSITSACSRTAWSRSAPAR